MDKTQNGRKKGNFFTNLFRNSIILCAIDRFTKYIYSLIQNGFFGYLFTGYRTSGCSMLGERLKKSKLVHHLGEFRYGISRHIESSLVYRLVLKFTDCLLGYRLKFYGTFLLSYATFRFIVEVYRSFNTSGFLALVQSTDALICFVLILASLPLIFSRISLAESLTESLIGKLILNITGFSKEYLKKIAHAPDFTGIAFVIGLAVAFLTRSLSPVYVLGGIAALIGGYLVLVKPEIGVLALFFLMPFLPTMVLAVLLIFTFLSWMLKLIRGKRVLRFERVDVFVVLFGILLLSGGVISISSDSLKPALLMVCLLIGYFLVVELIQTREWLVKCTTATVLSATLVSLYGIFSYYTGVGYFSSAWVDDEMFGIARRAVSTLENPNMLGEYLILVIPIAIAVFVGKGEGLKRFPTFVCLVLMGGCLVFTWSRGAWLALMVALVLFLFMWHYRSMWLVILGALSIPVLPYVLPQSIISRFASIGNMADSSTSYRVYIWRAAVNMIGDHAIGGIGIGEGAWSRVYPLYSYMGIEAAPHSHNLFLQIWLDLGIFGLLAFLAAIFLLFSSAFTFFSKLSRKTPLSSADLSESMMRFNRQTALSEKEAYLSSRYQLRMSVVGPLTGLLAVLVQGMTDYSWYNYRLYLIFWLVFGLASSYIRNGKAFLDGYDRTETNPESQDSIFVFSHRKRKAHQTEAAK